MPKVLSKGDWLIQRAHRIIGKVCRSVHGGPKWDGPCIQHKTAASLIALGDWSGGYKKYRAREKARARA